MKNPRFHADPAMVSTRTAFNEALLDMAREMASRSAISASQRILSAKDDEDNGFASVLKTLKFKPEEITRITKMVDTIGKLASIAGWVVGAVTTVKSVLTALGVFDEEEDATKALLYQIAARVESIYKFLQGEAELQIYIRQTIFLDSLAALRTEMNNLQNSRTQANIQKVKTMTDSLQKNIREMLRPKTARIHFNRKDFEYKSTYPPSHWIDAASPFFMKAGRSGEIPNYAKSAQNDTDAEQMIWDAGFFIAILFESIGLRIAALTAIEPAFRSTGYDRGDLAYIARNLLPFIEAWQNSILETRVVGPIDPVARGDVSYRVFGGFDIVTGHLLSHPFHWDADSIVLGVVDPTTGLAAMDYDYKKDFDLKLVNNGPRTNFGTPTPYWLLTNFSEATAAAQSRLSSMVLRMWKECGISRSYELYHHVWSLLFVPGGKSEFVDITNARTSLYLLRAAPEPEQVELGFLGDFAGRPGHKYKAERFHCNTVKKFRVPMARRMDMTHIQLGYRMTVSVGDPDAYANIVFCPYSAEVSPLVPELEIFPTKPATATIVADNAIIYDVLQTSLISLDQEDEFETTGTLAGQQRLFLNERRGRASLKVNVTFSFNEGDPDSSFVGYANVEITAPDEWPHSNGFVCDVTVYEERLEWVPDSSELGGHDQRMEIMADGVRLHFCPSFLVVEADYFTDREKGLTAMAKVMDEYNDRFSESHVHVAPNDPIERVTRVSQVERQMVAAFEAVKQTDPQMATEMLARYTPIPVAGPSDVQATKKRSSNNKH